MEARGGGRGGGGGGRECVASVWFKIDSLCWFIKLLGKRERERERERRRTGGCDASATAAAGHRWQPAAGEVAAGAEGRCRRPGRGGCRSGGYRGR